MLLLLIVLINIISTIMPANNNIFDTMRNTYVSHKRATFYFCDDEHNDIYEYNKNTCINRINRIVNNNNNNMKQYEPLYNNEIYISSISQKNYNIISPDLISFKVFIPSFLHKLFFK